ncbi:uncharacterized protein LOC129649598 [Bubalus kerabau]|uniref:uncharacterized protein LOC129649598 n=1 Tax=Bubalus carabanensis TaxID=3119969 RepID=UPI00244EA8F8|nr:uncharacterized protein LOC129649598 [Bubalus carabanensis]
MMMAHGILARWPRIDPMPPALEGDVPATGPPGKSLWKDPCRPCGRDADALQLKITGAHLAWNCEGENRSSEMLVGWLKGTLLGSREARVCLTPASRVLPHHTPSQQHGLDPGKTLLQDHGDPSWPVGALPWKLPSWVQSGGAVSSVGKANLGFPGGTVAKSSAASARDMRDMGSVPGLGRSARGGNGSPLQYSCLGNPMDRGAWRLQSVESRRVRHD